MIVSGSTDALKRNFASDIVFKLIIQAITLINHLLAFRVLGLAKFGQLEMWNVMVMFCTILANFGACEVLSRWISAYKKEERGNECIYTLIHVLLFLNIALGLLLGGLLIGFQEIWTRWFNLEDVTRLQALLVCGTFLMHIWLGVLENFLSANYEQPYLNRRSLVVTLLNIGLFYLFYFAFGISVTTMLMIGLISGAVNCLIILKKYLFASDFVWFSRYGFRVLRKDLPEMRKYAGSMWGNSVVGFLSSQRGLDYFILAVLGEAALGLYAIGQKLLSMPQNFLFPKSMRNYVGVYGFEVYHSGGVPALSDYCKKYMGYAIFASGFCAIGGIICIPGFLNVFYKISDPAAARSIQLMFFLWGIANVFSIFEYLISVFKLVHYYLLVKCVSTAIMLLSASLVLRFGGLDGGILLSNILVWGGYIFYLLLLVRQNCYCPVCSSRKAIWGVTVIFLVTYGLSCYFPIRNLWEGMLAALAVEAFWCAVVNYSGLFDIKHYGNEFLNKIYQKIYKKKLKGRP